jgi:hypothetical protein
MSFRRPRTAEEILSLDDDDASEVWPEGEGEQLAEDDEDADGTPRPASTTKTTATPTIPGWRTKTSSLILRRSYDPRRAVSQFIWAALLVARGAALGCANDSSEEGG